VSCFFELECLQLTIQDPTPLLLDPNNTNSTKKDFYSENIVEKFDAYYKKK